MSRLVEYVSSNHLTGMFGFHDRLLSRLSLVAHRKLNKMQVLLGNLDGPIRPNGLEYQRIPKKDRQ